MLFAYYDKCRIMVTVSSYEGTSGECPERIAFILTLLGNHERTLEHDAIETFFANRLYPETFRSICKVVIDKDKVIYAPLAAVCKTAVSGLVHGKERREEIR